MCHQVSRFLKATADGSGEDLVAERPVAVLFVAQTQWAQQGNAQWMQGRAEVLAVK